jgi:hypothetical protein
MIATGLIFTISGLVLFVAYVWSVVWSYRDAKRRGKSAFLVALLVALGTALGFLSWLIFRPSQPVAPPDPTHEKRWKWVLALGGSGFIGLVVRI